MEKSKYKIHIIGAGVSGLIAAQVLEKEGYTPVIYEKTDRAGGRVKTDIVQGYQLDHGFQVLLDAYPLAKKYLDFNALEVQPFLPGAVIFNNGEREVLGDPLRALSLLWPTLISKSGTLLDKLKILKLNMSLGRTSVKNIFSATETSTEDFLRSKGFSETIISDFFRPFFSGIFLEPDLATSSRMFNFVYKMFGEGMAVIPRNGIGAIPEQLVGALKNISIQYNKEISKVSEGKIVCKDGTVIDSDYTLLATENMALLNSTPERNASWKKCDTLYFTVDKRNIKKALIGLVANKKALINNIFYHTSLDMRQSGGKELLSVTVVKEHTLTTEELVEKVQQELFAYCNIQNTTFLKHYKIPKALPQLTDISYGPSSKDVQLSKTLFTCGDHTANASLNAAMLSGEVAAKSIIRTIEIKK